MNDRNQLFVGLLILVVAVGLGVWQWSEIQAMKEQTTAIQSEATNLTSFRKTLADEYKEIKVDVTAAREQTEQALSQVLPAGEDITSLTRLFDNYEAANNFASNPFFISAIQYAAPSTSQQTGTYRSVTLDLSADASKKNLSKFLEMIENSGSLEAETRLMSVDNLNIAYPDEYGGTYTIRAEVLAYYAPAL